MGTLSQFIARHNARWLDASVSMELVKVICKQELSGIDLSDLSADDRQWLMSLCDAAVNLVRERFDMREK
jgi:hypothetical protein